MDQAIGAAASKHFIDGFADILSLLAPDSSANKQALALAGCHTWPRKSSWSAIVHRLCRCWVSGCNLLCSTSLQEGALAQLFSIKDWLTFLRLSPNAARTVLCNAAMKSLHSEYNKK